MRERNYYFETLNPGHEPKPQVEGYATERISEHLTRGLIATPSPDGNGIHLSWRLLNADPDEVSFHVYRMADGKQKRLTRKAIREVCDYTDYTPSDKPMSYWVTAHDAKGKVIDTSEKLTVDKSLLTHYRSVKLRDPKMRVGKVAVADLNGDWREEIVMSLPGELRIYTTNNPARDRRVTLMQDAIYRSYVAHRSMGYPQAPVPSYYLGE